MGVVQRGDGAHPRKRPGGGDRVHLTEYGRQRSELLAAVRRLTEQYFRPVAGAQALRLASPLSRENVVGVGIGERYIGNRPTGELAIKVHVVAKVPASQLDARVLLPDRIGTIDVDVEAVGRIELRARTDRARPAVGGISVGHFRITAGTFGCLVRVGGQAHILSNNHVLADQNRGQRGDPILQPGPADGGQPGQDEIARLADWAPVHEDGVTANHIDAGLALPHDAGDVGPEILDTDGPRGAGRTQINQPVLKSGRTSGLTRGVVTDVDFTLRIPFGSGVALFAEQVAMKGVGGQVPFSEPGDSGSVILDEETQNACGLLFAGSSVADVTYANVLQNVLDHFHGELVPR